MIPRNIVFFKLCTEACTKQCLTEQQLIICGILLKKKGNLSISSLRLRNSDNHRKSKQKNGKCKSSNNN